PHDSAPPPMPPMPPMSAHEPPPEPRDFAPAPDVPIPSLANAPSRQYPVDHANQPRPRSRLPWILGGVLAALVLGATAFIVIPILTSDDNVRPIANTKADAGVKVAAADAAKATSADAQVVATT